MLPSSEDTGREVLHEIIARAGGFGHREHLELAWRLLDLLGPDREKPTMVAAIREVAAAHGAADRYHETITMTWLHLVELHRRADEHATFTGFLEANEGLLDSRLPERHYSRRLLESADGRTQWMAADLLPLPEHA
jgi:hypothetical protein